MIFEDGIYERLLSELEFAQFNRESSSIRSVSNFEDKKALLRSYLGDLVSAQIEAAEDDASLQYLVSKLNNAAGGAPLAISNNEFKELRWVSSRAHQDRDRFDNMRPITPVGEMALFTNARDEPRIDLELERELATSDSVDILVSFIKISGLRLLETQLLKLRDRGVLVRLITTTYMGATDKKAIDRLVNELGVRVRIDLSPNSNRLHAKAWKFTRASGYSTAYIGSSNMSRAALTSGSEWNVRLSEAQTPSLFEKFETSFDTYWESKEYREYSTEALGQALEEALSRQGKGESGYVLISQLEVIPKPHQIQMLEELKVAREVFGYSRNLVVAATGTGKTVLAALDYKRLIEPGQPRPRLLFVAHRKEILQQAMATFRQVLGDGAFGELWVDGMMPKTWDHVFASVQSFSMAKISGLPVDHFHHLIVDEFHHAEASSYRAIFKSLEPDQVVGLTATPERSDGVDQIWRDEFGGRIASELRLWDAIGRDLLAPFHYFGISEDIDYSNVPWVGGKYEVTALSKLVTSNTFRNRKVLKELEAKVASLEAMKALIFCSSVEHARQVADEFSSLGVTTEAVTGETANRGQIIQRLRSGQIQAIATVDVFNEGVDIPELDTIVLLRPTESPTVFLQQIGRGLRLFPGKDHVLILDFIGAHRAEYRIDKKFEALSGKPRSEVIKNLQEGFPYLPSGSAIQLDQLSTERVLNLIKEQVSPAWKRLAAEVKAYGTSSLKEYLELSGRDLFEIYRDSGKTWVLLLSASELLAMDISDFDHVLLKLVSRLLHVDDAQRIGALESLLKADAPRWLEMDDFERRSASMIFWNLFVDGNKPGTSDTWGSIDDAFDALRMSEPFVKEVSGLLEVLRQRIRHVGSQISVQSVWQPLVTHATYSRYELLGALGYGRLPGSSVYETGQLRSIAGAREGVYFVAESKVDLFLVTLQKSERLSPSIRYHDYAISNSIFHWESQSRTTPESPTGERYINHRSRGTDVLIATRQTASDGNGTVHFKLLGLADYMKHEGSQPIKIWWHLREPMDPETFEIAAAAKVG
jgi:superfamily II DNA or RNA helicase